eukprot:1688534-Amphidinium_carterae.1
MADMEAIQTSLRVGHQEQFVSSETCRAGEPDVDCFGDMGARSARVRSETELSQAVGRGRQDGHTTSGDTST